MGTVSSLLVRRELRAVQAERRALVEQRVHWELASGNPALREQLATQAEREALRLRLRYRFLLRFVGGPLLAMIEHMLLARRLRGEPENYDDALALILGDHRHVRLDEHIEQRRAELVDAIVKEECK
jgi:hypothetical protein